MAQTAAEPPATHARTRWQSEIEEHAQELYPNLVDRRWTAAKLADFWIVMSLHPSFRVRVLHAVGAHEDEVTSIVANFSLKILPRFNPDSFAISVFETFTYDEAKPTRSQLDQLVSVLNLGQSKHPDEYSMRGALALVGAALAEDSETTCSRLADAAGLAAMPLLDLFGDDPRGLANASYWFVEVCGFHDFAGYCNALKRKGELD